MPDCRSVDPLLTPFVDAELTPDRQQTVLDHLRVCARCYSRVEAERSVRQVLGARRDALCAQAAPPELAERCASLAAPLYVDDAGMTTAPGLRSVPWALAAALVVMVAGAGTYVLTRNSVRVMAAELAADHMKCFVMNTLLGTQHTHADVEQWMAASFGWEADLPDSMERAGLELVGARTCLYGEGRVAHVMYKYQGRPVSVFMLPGTERPQDLIGVMGYEEAVWPADGHTFVLVADGPRAEVQQIASVLQASLH